jgi:hypothetical protein
VRDEQGFGKKRSGVSMPRPKKKQVEQTAALLNSTLGGSTGTSAEEEMSASTGVAEDKGSCDGSLEAQEKELRAWAKGKIAEQRKVVQELSVVLRKAEAALRHEQRLAEEREKRWWAAERYSEPPPPYLQLERVYKSKVKDLQAH